MTVEKLLAFQTKRELLKNELLELETKFLQSMSSEDKTDFHIATENYIEALDIYTDFVKEFMEVK